MNGADADSIKEKASAGSIHWIHILLALALPFVFVTGMHPAFIPVKTAVLVFGAAALSLAMVFWIRGRTETVLNIRREHLYLAGFVVWMLASIFWSPDLFGALAEWLPLASAAMIWFSWSLYYGNEDQDNRKQFELVQTVVLVGLLESLVVLVQYFGFGLRFNEDVVGKWRVVGTFGNPNYVAEFLVPVFFLALNLLHHETRTVHRKFYLASIFFLVLAIAATWSRTGWLLLAGGLVLYAWIFTRQSRQRISSMLYLVMARARWYLLSLFALLTVVLVLFPVIRIDRTLMRHAANTASISGRFFIWEHSLDAMVDHVPFGSGIGGFAKAWEDAQYRHFSTGDTSGVNHAWINDRAHNDFIQYAVEGGIGVILFILFWARILRKGAGGFRHNDLSIGVFVALVLLLVSSLGNFPFRVPPNLWLVMFLAALVSQHRHLDNEQTIFRLDLSRAKNRMLGPLLVFALVGVVWGTGHILSAAHLRAGEDALGKKDEENAREHFRLAVHFDPGNARAHIRYARLLADYGDLRGADRHARQSLDILPFPEAWAVSALAAASSGSNELAVSLLERRSTTYRKIPGFAADTIRALADAGKVDAAFLEVQRLNAILGEIDLESTDWEQAILRANGAACLARMARRGIWYPAFQANPAIVEHDGGIWTADSGFLHREELRDGKWTRVRSHAFPRAQDVLSLCSRGHEIIVGCREGVFLLDTKTGSVRRIPGIRGRVPWLALSETAIWLIEDHDLVRVDEPGEGILRISGVKGRNLGIPGSLAIRGGRIAVSSSSNLFLFDTDGNGAWESVPWTVRDCVPFRQGVSLLVTDEKVHLWQHGQSKPLDSWTHAIPGARILEIGSDFFTLSDGAEFRQIPVSGKTNFVLPPELPGRLGVERSKAAIRTGTNTFVVARSGRIQPADSARTDLIASPLKIGLHAGQIWIADLPGLKRALVTTNLIVPVSSKGPVLMASDVSNFCLFSGGELVLSIEGKPGRTLARDVRGIRALAVDAGQVLAGYEDGRILRHDDGTGSLVWQCTNSIDALVQRDGVAYVAVSGEGIYRLVQGQKPVLVLDGTSGIDISGVSAMSIHGDELYIGSRHGLVVFDCRSGSARMIDVVAGGAVQALTQGFGNYGTALAVFDNELVLLGRQGRVILRLQGGPDWPKRISSAAVTDDLLVVAGESGVRVYQDINNALQPWIPYFRRNK
ncbi:MAG TPA: O-antigen ligase family protein [Spirochaetota bacterium]|nr:O-antigen ligase family protein [Spirochaetota bacterium]